MDVNACLTPSSSSSVSIYPCWPLCRGELSPSGAGMGLWLWGAAGWGCCTPEVLLHFCPTSPTLRSTSRAPLMKTHAQALLFLFFPSLAATPHGAGFLCAHIQLIHSDDPQLRSSLLSGTQLPFVMFTIISVASQLTFGLGGKKKSRDELRELCSSTHVILLNHALSFMLRDTSGDYSSLLVSLDFKVTTQQLSSASMQLSRVVYRSKVGRFGWLLQNTTEHLLVVASICRETPPKT